MDIGSGSEVWSLLPPTPPTHHGLQAVGRKRMLRWEETFVTILCLDSSYVTVG
jgi:hypothetical protein